MEKFKEKMTTIIEKTCYDEHSKNLFKAVMEQLNESWEEVYKNSEDYRDASTGISGFTYYSDTEQFAKRNIDDILYCLNEFEEEIGTPLKKDNKHLLNWYAWFALEYVIDKIIIYKENIYN